MHRPSFLFRGSRPSTTPPVRPPLGTVLRAGLTLTVLTGVSTGVALVTHGSTSGRAAVGRVPASERQLGLQPDSRNLVLAGPPRPGSTITSQGASGPAVGSGRDSDRAQLQAAAQFGSQAAAQSRSRAAVASQSQAAAQAAAQKSRSAAAQAEADRKAAAAQVARDAARDPKSAARLMLADHGWGSGQFGCLDSLWTRESGWNYQARNPASGATGIPQALPGSKMASAGADWRTNPVTQIRWGLGYIADVYGTPCGAWAHSRATGWY